MKTCSICNIEKEDIEFGKRRLQCKLCIKESKKGYYQENKEFLKEYQKVYQQNNKDSKKEYDKEYRQKNKDSIRESRKEYNKEYKQNNKDSIRESAKEYKKKRYKNDAKFRLRYIISSAIYRYLNNKGLSKNGQSILNNLPYTMLELEAHIESLFEPWMTWKNQGTYVESQWDENNTNTWWWQLDHRIPHSWFDYEAMKDIEFIQCWSLSNLRPLSAKQNIEDGNRR